jgi:eukaryotic-like serine/threonine-protein kinase
MPTPNEAPTAPVTEGDGLPRESDVIAGKYRVERTLGRGGMGVVIAAEDITLRRKVAVKLILPEAVSRAGATERFLREARSAAAIQSEHVARVIDISTLESGAPFMVMEYLTGTDLGHVLRERGPLPVEEAVDYVLQACEAIAEAHALGIIHRDLKPANLFLTTRADGSSLVKVLDFGLAKAIRPDAPSAMELSLTATGTTLGSPHYMSPEQVRNLKTIDNRTDIWALGVILYQLITGHRPFEDESLGGLFIMIGSEAPKPIQAWEMNLHPQLETVIMRCLEKELPARTQTVAEFARGLSPFGSMGSRLSVERILRVLSDHTPLPPPRGSESSYPDDSQNSPSGRISVPVAPGRVSGPGSAPRLSSQPGHAGPGSGPGKVAPRGGIDSSTAMASTLAQGEVGPPERLNTERTLPKPPRRLVPLVVGGAVSVVVLGTVALFMLRPGPTPSGSGNALAPGVPLPSAQVEATPTAFAVIPSAESIAPPPSATTEAAPAPSASASATASASASAAAAAPKATAAPKPPAVKTGPVRPGQPATKKNPRDPMDLWR